MGCAESKQEVATGNTMRRSRLRMTKADAAELSMHEHGSTSGEAASNSVDVRDIGVSVGGRAAAGSSPEEEQEVDRKPVSRGSPDRFFSPRKDDESSEGDFFSPRYDYEPHGEVNPQTRELHQHPIQTLGKLINGDASRDLKERILVEETNVEVATVDIGETARDPMITQANEQR